MITEILEGFRQEYFEYYGKYYLDILALLVIALIFIMWLLI
jgi:hypothetical protein